MQDFLRKSLQDRFEWGRTDCALWAASAFEAVTGFDPAKELRGTYSTAFECRKIVIRNGGMLSLCKRLMAPAPARDFDGEGIGVFMVEGQLLAGVVVNNRLHVRTESGILVKDGYDMRAGWSW